VVLGIIILCLDVRGPARPAENMLTADSDSAATLFTVPKIFASVLESE
jgi:hypothetical protein